MSGRPINVTEAAPVKARSSYEDVYLHLGPPNGTLVRILIRMTGDIDEARDLAQETLSRLWLNYEAIDNPDAWCVRVGTRLFLDLSRHRRTADRFQPLVAEAAANDGAAFDRVAVRLAMTQLHPSQRALLILRYYCDLGLADVADVLGLNPSTCRGLAVQAQAALKRLIEERP
ncbi:MAG: RNA polymerase sigma factor [Actinomycetota bacterium]|nr:RNA polymerase sigma factor [Actinomycetota bacterium]